MRSMKRWFLFIVFAFLFIFPTVIIAQGDLTQTYTSPDGKFSISYPTGWTSTDEGDLIRFNGGSGFIQINFYDNNNSGYAPVTALELLEVGAGEDQEMRAVLEFTELEELIIAGFPAVQSGSNMMGQFITIIDFGDGVLGNVSGYTSEGQLDTLKPTVMAMMESIQYGDGPPPIVETPLDNLQPITSANAAGVSQLMTLGDGTVPVTSVTFSPDNRLIAFGTADGKVQLWDVATGENRVVLEGHTGGVTSIAFGAGGYLIAVGTGSGDVRLWDATTGEGSGFMQKHTGAVESVAFQQDDFLVASGALEGGVQLWDVAARAEQMTLVDADNPIPVTSLVFSPDGTKLAVGGGSTLQLWDAATNTMQTTIETEVNDIASVAFSPDGTSLIYGGADSSVWTWNLGSDNRALLQGHTGIVSALAYTSDGQVIASSDADTVRLWDAATGENKATLAGQSVSSIAFSPDGTLLVSGGETGGAVLWGTTSDSAASQATISESTSETAEAATNEEITTSASICTVTAPNNANLRSGPGTDFERAGALSPGQTAEVDGQANGNDGMTWYRLTDGAWVRSDIVGTPAECGGVPIVTP